MIFICFHQVFIYKIVLILLVKWKRENNFDKKKKSFLLGNGCVVNLPELIDEIKKNESRGVTNWSKRLFISDRAHLGKKKLNFCF
jgi:hypothetical protein